MHSRFRDDHAAIAVPDQYARAGFVENPLRGGHVRREARFRFLDNAHRIAVALEDVRYGLPPGAIRKGAVDENDGLDLRMRREGRRYGSAYDQSEKQSLRAVSHVCLRGSCPASEVRDPSRQPLTRTSEAKGHWQVNDSSCRFSI